jgi:hypothetical protein
MQVFTVIFTVKVSGTSIGAGLRTIQQKVTFRDLSRSIDSDNDCRDASTRVSAGQGNAQEGPASNAISYCHDLLFRPLFYRHAPTGAVLSGLAGSWRTDASPNVKLLARLLVSLAHACDHERCLGANHRLARFVRQSGPGQRA